MTVKKNEREQTRAAWDAIAPAFDVHATPLSRPLAADALQRAGVQAGASVLDVAAGSGSLALEAARRGARVVATDLSATMLERLRARAEAEGLTEVETREMDGNALELADGVYDVSASQNGVSLFPDVGRGLRELTRVTKPGGRVLLVTFASPARAEFITFFVRAVATAVPGFTGPPMDPPPLPFQLADREVLRRALADAGLERVEVATSAWPIEVGSASHLWDVVTSSNPIGAMMVADLAQEQRTAALAELQGILDARAEGRTTALLTTEMHIAIGSKPPVPGGTMA